MPALFHRFSPRLVDDLRRYDRTAFAADLGAGLTVAIVALPLAMAFAIASGVKPEQGIFTAIVAGFLISALGGSSVQIGGPAGAYIVIVYGLVQRFGVANLMVATMVAGLLLLIMGWMRLGAMVRFIPVSVVTGFTNGIAVLIALSQVRDALGLHLARMPAEFFSQVATLASHLGQTSPTALALCGVSLAILLAWPRPGMQASAPTRPARALLARIPAPIVVLGLATIVAALAHLPVDTIGSRFGGVPRALPALALPTPSWPGGADLLRAAFTIAFLGAIESLLCARVADTLTHAPRHDPNQELMAQGLANIVGPVFGGIPATGTIARTVTNIRAGARTPVAGIVHALTLLAVMLAAAPLASSVPLCVLASILLFVAWNMGDWHEFGRLRHLSLEHRVKFLATFILTVTVDLSVAVEVGMLLAAGFFIYRIGSLFRVDELPPEPQRPARTRIFGLHGALFFATAGRLEAIGEGEEMKDCTVVLDVEDLQSIDTSGIEAVLQMRQRLERAGARLLLCGLRAQPLQLFQQTRALSRLGDAVVVPDRAAALAAAAVR